MRRTYCDICDEIFKIKDKKVLLAIKEATHLEHEEEEEPIQDMQSYLKNVNRRFDEIKVFEICLKCRNILTYLFKMRRQEREKILKKMEKSYNQKYIKPQKEGNK